MLDLVHFVHIAGATVFVGSVVFFDWAVGGALARMTPEARKSAAHAIRPFSGPIIMGSLAVTLLAGIARLFLSGAVTGWADLFSGYAGRAILALVIVIASEGLAAPFRKHMRAGIDTLDDSAFLLWWKRYRSLNALVLAAVLLLMVSMRMGW